MAGVRFLTPNLSDVHVRVSGKNVIVTVDDGVEISILEQAQASIRMARILHLGLLV